MVMVLLGRVLIGALMHVDEIKITADLDADTITVAVASPGVKPVRGHRIVTPVTVAARLFDSDPDAFAEIVSKTVVAHLRNDIDPRGTT